MSQQWEQDHGAKNRTEPAIVSHPEPVASRVPEIEIGGDVDLQVGRAVRRRQAAAGADGRDRVADGQRDRSSAPQTCERCSRSVPEPMCMCRPAIFSPGFAARRRHSAICSCQMPCFDCSPPVLVFWLWPWPKPGLTRSVISRPGRAFTELLDHVGRAAIDVDTLGDDQVERLAIEDIGRVDDRRRIAGRRVSGGHGPADFTGADRVDQHALATHQIENRQVRVGLLGVADRIERPQVVDPPPDHRGFIDEGGRAKLAGDRYGHSGDRATSGNKVVAAVVMLKLLRTSIQSGRPRRHPAIPLWSNQTTIPAVRCCYRPV